MKQANASKPRKSGQIFKSPSPKHINDNSAVEPWMLWLPPDRLGYNLYDTQLNYQVACKALEMGGVNGVEFYRHLKKDKKEICYAASGKALMTCGCRSVAYCKDCVPQLLKAALETGKLSCPLCRRNTYFLAIEWLFEPDPEHHREEMRKNKRARNTENRRRRRARKAEEKKPSKS
ncbi:hypothetical protein BDP27DRAFT_1370990 [Rhodocollybia butyracea]|uniref:Uncharacterized protein n=1 Tax=Rhodocollybia butyracea TaxID=206335 RepID=A0A9P5TZY3_9AGAR|nr:hypothetical protein BDP27DRAFT_1370990 [Rhodocollybia butyracea]